MSLIDNHDISWFVLRSRAKQNKTEQNPTIKIYITIQILGTALTVLANQLKNMSKKWFLIYSSKYLRLGWRTACAVRQMSTCCFSRVAHVCSACLGAQENLFWLLQWFAGNHFWYAIRLQIPVLSITVISCSVQNISAAKVRLSSDPFSQYVFTVIKFPNKPR